MNQPNLSTQATTLQLPESNLMRALFQTHRVSLGYLFVLAVPVGAAVSMLFDGDVGGFNLSGWLWFLYLIVGGTLIAVECTFATRFRIALPYRPWLIWFGFVWTSLLWCPSLGLRNVQDALQISMPLLVGIAAALFVNTERGLQGLFQAFTLTLVILCLHAGLSVFSDGDRVLGARVFSMTAALIGCLYIAHCPERITGPICGWGICILLTAGVGSRTATAALLLVPIFNPQFRGALWRIAAVAGMAGLAIVLFYTSVFQQRFFHTGSGTLSQVFQGEFLSFGRFEAWPLIWDEAWKRPLLGHGVGTTFSFVPRVWEGMTLVHNDYLRIGFECGLVGLALFVSVMLWQMWHLCLQIPRTQGVVRYAFAASLMGLTVFAIISTTDNVLIYNLWYTNPLFLLMGAAYGVAEQQRNRPALSGNQLHAGSHKAPSPQTSTAIHVGN